ncbi:ptzP [Candidatus Endolissoclinum faulkneri L5]|uniref:PtzP n=1 Tax=Candidatus Endolissoclinum faulkneri L5 TaxID=1401328 RepID=V9TXD0_9PROT|nr:SagB/ThcOx family dehydrogenase [Candidatus Endolissoclinum faulkneri]AHC73985.1 ptzP [Candidatus Endolissoclinum faulkneri L5]
MTNTLLNNEARISLRINQSGASLRRDGLRIIIDDGKKSPDVLDMTNQQIANLISLLEQPQGIDEQTLVAWRDNAKIYSAIEWLSCRSSLRWELTQREQPIAQAITISKKFQLEKKIGAIDPAAHLRRADNGDMKFPVIFSCTGLSYHIFLSIEGAKLASSLLAGIVSYDNKTLNDFLLGCGAANGSLATRDWAFADRIMHDATRPQDDGRTIAIIPKTNVQQLPIPEWRRIDSTSLPNKSIARIFEKRRSVRDFSLQPPNAVTLRSLLTHALAFQKVRCLGATRWVERAFPAAGGLGELIGYLAVRTGEDLETGLYRHDPLLDQLSPIPSEANAMYRLFDGASKAMMRSNHPPPVMLILASRVDLLVQKYGTLGYRLALLNVGSAGATVELMASEIGLGSCLLGTSEVRNLTTLIDQKDISDITGGFTETPLLEMALGLQSHADMQ